MVGFVVSTHLIGRFGCKSNFDWLALFIELGHNWGSEHDPDTAECSPSAELGGKYIMYTYSVSGFDANNKVSNRPISFQRI